MALDLTRDTARVLRYLGLLATQKDEVSEKLSGLERDLPDLIDVVTSNLDRLDELDAILSNELGTANFALIKADVLSWQSDRRVVGIATEYVRKAREIARLIDLEPDLSNIENALSIARGQAVRPNYFGKVVRG